MFPVVGTWKVAYKDSNMPSAFTVCLFITCVVLVVFIAWCNENKMSSLDMDSQLLLGCEPQGQKQNLAPAGLSLKAWALNGHLLVYVSVFLVT